MKALSIIGTIFFAFIFYVTCEVFVEMEETLGEIETLGSWANLLGAGNDLNTFSDNVYATLGLSLLACIYGFALSVVGIVKSNRKTNNSLNTNEELMQLGHLRDSGILSEDEFEAKKRTLMSK